MNLNIAILEDNKENFKTLQTKLTNWSQNNGHVLHTEWFTGKEILSSEFMKSCHLLFADIELDSSVSANGIKLCSTLRENGYSGEIVFLTAFKEYVFSGYDVLAMNYLLKPISDEALEKNMKRFVSIHNSNCYIYKKEGNVYQIPFHDIVSISRIGHICNIQTLTKTYSENNISLKSIETRLPKHFIRCHRSCIVNIHHITSISKNVITLSNKKTQIIGRLYLTSVRNAILDFAN